MRRYTLYKYSSRLMAVLLVCTLLATCFPAALADGESGTCGDGLSWSLSGGTLTVTGSGEMANFYEPDMAPWYSLRNQIYRVELPDGLTSIGSLAFYGCDELTAVTIPGSVTRIGSYAFAGCTGMQILSLGSGVKNIGEAAFSDCYALADLQLPSGLQTIGLKTFYRCESITTVTVPSSVTSLGISAFAYCKSLVSADVQAQISEVPELLFYGCERLVSVTLPDSADVISEFAFRGCDNLNTVYYDGSNKTAAEIQQIVGAGVPGFEDTGFVSNGTPTDTVISGTATENADGTVTQENTTVHQGANSTVSSTITSTHPADTNDGSYDLDITVNVNNQQGWDEAEDVVNETLEDYNNAVTSNGGTSGKTEITVYVKDSETIDQGFVDSLTDRDVTVTVVTQNGSVWKMESENLGNQTESEGYNLSYEVSIGSAELCQELGVSSCYVLRFLAPAQINAEVMIRLNADLALQNATLLQRNKKELEQIQTSVVDNDGYAHFYLASVSEETEYCIAINLPAPEQEAIIPESMQSAYGNLEQIQPIQYEITGRTSSWGLNIGQVTWIMIGVMVGSVVIVGFVLYFLNKRKLKMGYIPDLDDEE